MRNISTICLALLVFSFNSNLNATNSDGNSQLNLTSFGVADYAMDKAASAKIDALIKTIRDSLNKALSNLSTPQTSSREMGPSSQFCKEAIDVFLGDGGGKDDYGYPNYAPKLFDSDTGVSNDAISNACEFGTSLVNKNKCIKFLEKLRKQFWDCFGN